MKMKKNLLLMVLILFLVPVFLSGCANPKAENSSNFKRAILNYMKKNKELYLVKNISTGNNNGFYGYENPEINEFKSVLTRLSKAGLIKKYIKMETAAEQGAIFGPGINTPKPVLIGYVLTAKGKNNKYISWYSGYYLNVKIARVSSIKIDNYTKMNFAGVKAVSVRYNIYYQPFKWYTSLSSKRTVIPPVKNAHITLQLTHKGWRVSR